jgi:hypothetical protein
MSYIREEHRVVEDHDPGIVVDDPGGYRRGYNPAPIIAGILIALLIVFLILFGMNRGKGADNVDTRNNGPKITVPSGGSGSSNTTTKGGTSTGSNTQTSTKTSTP